MSEVVDNLAEETVGAEAPAVADQSAEQQTSESTASLPIAMVLWICCYT